MKKHKKNPSYLKNPRKNPRQSEKTQEPKIGSKNPRSWKKTQGVATLIGATLLYHRRPITRLLRHATSCIIQPRNSHTAIILAIKLSPHNLVICFFKSSFVSISLVEYLFYHLT